MQNEVQKLFQGPNLFTYSTNDRQDCLNTSVIVSYSAENHAVTSFLPCAEWRSNGPKDSSRSDSNRGNHKEDCTMQKMQISKPLPLGFDMGK